MEIEVNGALLASVALDGPPGPGVLVQRELRGNSVHFSVCSKPAVINCVMLGYLERRNTAARVRNGPEEGGRESSSAIEPQGANQQLPLAWHSVNCLLGVRQHLDLGKLHSVSLATSRSLLSSGSLSQSKQRRGFAAADTAARRLSPPSESLSLKRPTNRMLSSTDASPVEPVSAAIGTAVVDAIKFHFC